MYDPPQIDPIDQLHDYFVRRGLIEDDPEIVWEKCELYDEDNGDRCDNCGERSIDIYHSDQLEKYWCKKCVDSMEDSK